MLSEIPVSGSVIVQGNVVAGASDVRRSGVGGAQQAADQLPLAEDMESVSADEPRVAELLLQAQVKTADRADDASPAPWR